MFKQHPEKSFRKRDMWQILLTTFTIIMAIAICLQVVLMYQQKEILEKTSQPNAPELEIQLIPEESNSYFKISDIQGLIVENLDFNFKNESKFWAKQEEIDFVVLNKGRIPAGYVHFYSSFEDLNLDGNYDSLFLNESSRDFLSLNFKDRNCGGDSGEKRYLKSKNKCYNSNLTSGNKKVFLKIDCDFCVTEENPSCYEFNICLYDKFEDKELCKEELPLERFKLKKIECPKETN